jgi:hypothetical protein
VYGSFDSAGASLREDPTVLRMTKWIRLRNPTLAHRTRKDRAPASYIQSHDTLTSLAGAPLQQYVRTDAHPNHIKRSRRIGAVPTAVHNEAGGTDHVHPLV